MTEQTGGRCPHGQDGDWRGLAGDFLPCECCGGPVSVLGAFVPPPRCADCAKQTDAAEVLDALIAQIDTGLAQGATSAPTPLAWATVAQQLHDLRRNLATDRAAAEVRGAQAALLKAADDAVPAFNMHPANQSNTVADWLRARAAAAAAGGGGEA